MDTIQKTVLIIHTLIALLIIVLVLLQRGKGADAGAAFGAGASGTVFGSRGSGSFFSRATAVCATAFFVSSLTLAYLSSQSSSAPTSLLENAPAIEDTSDEVVPTNEDLPVPDMPSLEPEIDATGSEGDMPSLDEAKVEADDVEDNP